MATSLPRLAASMIAARIELTTFADVESLSSPSRFQERGVAPAAAEIGAVSVRHLHEVNRREHAMANAINIEKLATGRTGGYVARVDAVEGEAELVFTIRGPALISAGAFLPSLRS